MLCSILSFVYFREIGDKQKAENIDILVNPTVQEEEDDNDDDYSVEEIIIEEDEESEPDDDDANKKQEKKPEPESKLAQIITQQANKQIIEQPQHDEHKV